MTRYSEVTRQPAAVDDTGVMRNFPPRPLSPTSELAADYRGSAALDRAATVVSPGHSHART
jgi:hypothetical protein